VSRKKSETEKGIGTCRKQSKVEGKKNVSNAELALQGKKEGKEGGVGFALGTAMGR